MYEVVYKAIERELHDRSDVDRVLSAFDIRYETALAIFWQSNQRRVQFSTRNVRSKIAKYDAMMLGAAREGRASKQAPRSVLEVARIASTSPCTLVRRVLEGRGWSKREITDAFKDPERVLQRFPYIHGPLLTALEHDDIYAPAGDRLRRALGIEYEIRLQQHLENLGARFETEDDLRLRGEFKTPDALLHVPIAVQVKTRTRVGNAATTPFEEQSEIRLVTWIDSKAKFGDHDSLKQDYVSSIASYVGRFGPGLVLYWFGFVEDANVPMLSDRGVLVMDEFPSPDAVYQLEA
ncbi:hypothetical protein FVE85_7264 [Porphyridium purpureum]|uniref:CDAN1-interacting nuclease 1 n=1 Tax=Porphyridium purpureum TaxID=35688 RepID=A0A5J4Z6J7_PORPP|nr:hypothetical protein FVE85_7264 [Porphyridium purpureum]|eukprot:POR2136..scf295_1